MSYTACDVIRDDVAAEQPRLASHIDTQAAAGKRSLRELRALQIEFHEACRAAYGWKYLAEQGEWSTLCKFSTNTILQHSPVAVLRAVCAWTQLVM